MAVPAQLLEQVMQLPEGERLELVEQVMAASTSAEVAAEGVDRDALNAVLDASERDVAAGRTRRFDELLAELKARG